MTSDSEIRTPANARDSWLPSYSPGAWRVVNDLWQDERANPGVQVKQCPPVTKVMNRQAVSFDLLKSLEYAGVVRAYIGAEWIDVELNDLTWGQVTAAKRAAQIRITLTPHGLRLACDPLNMVLRSAWRSPRRYTVADVTRSAGIAGPDVKPVLVTLEALGLVEACNDQGAVELAMWKRAEIPPHLRLRLTRKGGTYLNRK